MAEIHLSLETEQNQVLFEGDSFIRTIILNRPHKLNCFSYEMLAQMIRNLKLYENDNQVGLLILKGNGRAFSSGGDLEACIICVAAGHWSFGTSYYAKLLTLIYLVATYRKPMVCIINGIVIGGGAGISLYGSFRIVTEKTQFSMPEASIGHFPDAGASHFLSKLPGFLGEYLGLTGAQLDGASMLACGLATHFVLSKDLCALEKAIQEASSSDLSTINNVINKFSHQPSIAKDCAFSRLKIINECFSKNTVEEMIFSLKSRANEGIDEKWTNETIKSINYASPTSLKIFLRSIREGRGQKLDQCLVREYAIFCHLVRTANNDFHEGLKTLAMHKGRQAKWVPSTLAQVTHEMVDEHFNKTNDGDWNFLELPSRSDTVESMRPRL